MSFTATNQALGYYLHGCANVAMARTPQQALAELHKTQSALLDHSVATIAEAARLCRKQNSELLVMPGTPARTPKHHRRR